MCRKTRKNGVIWYNMEAVMREMTDLDLTLLSDGQIWGNDKESQLVVIRKYGKKLQSQIYVY